MAPSTSATRAGTGPERDQVRPIASQPQTIATGPRTIPSTKNPATAQMTPMIPSVARSGPVRDHVRPRERGYLRVPCPKPAIINSLNPGVCSGFNERVPLVRVLIPGLFPRAGGALSPSGSAPQHRSFDHCGLRRAPGARNL
jgi:hypothetical protein